VLLRSKDCHEPFLRLGVIYVQPEKHAEDKKEASQAPEDMTVPSDKKEEASVEENPVPASVIDALTPGKRWSARVVLMSGVNARFDTAKRVQSIIVCPKRLIRLPTLKHM